MTAISSGSGFTPRPQVRSECCGHDHDHGAELSGVTPVQVSPDEEKQYRDLVDSAVEGRTHAYAPISHSLVGSAVLTANGKVYEGANFEDTTYADHGEQFAIERALADGQKPSDILASATFVAKDKPGGPTEEDFHNQANMTSCGNCRQAIYEINPDMREVLLAPDGQHVVVYKAEDMLPKAYHRSHEPLPNTAPPTSDNPDPLIAAGLVARSRAFVPRTNEPVGAAVETADGHIYKGVQVETSSFSTQAPRVALDEALFHGEHDIKRMVIVGGTNAEGEVPKRLAWDSFQALAQQSPNAEVVLPDGHGGFHSLPVSEVPGYLLSHPNG